MHTDNLKSILADHLGIDISQLTDDRSLGDLGLDEVDIEELLLALEEELDTASDAPTFAPLTLPFLGTDVPLTPDSTVGELMAYIHPR